MGFLEILTIIFILLKVFGVIGWSWWLVLLPEIIAVVLYVAVFLLGILGIGKSTKRITKSFKDF